MNLYQLQYLIQSEKQTITLIGFFLLIFVMIYSILMKIKIISEEKAPNTVIALVISLLTIFYLSQSQKELLNSIYSLFGFFILFLIPLIIVIAILHKSKLESGTRRLIILLYGLFTLYYINNKIYDLNQTNLILITISITAAIIFDKSINKSLNE